MEAKVIVRCVQCNATREIKRGEIPEGDVPMCLRCGMPMVAIKAEAS